MVVPHQSISTACLTISGKSLVWILNSSASTLVSGNKTLFHDLVFSPSHTPVNLVNDSKSSITSVRNVPTPIPLTSILYAHGFLLNLASVANQQNP